MIWVGTSGYNYPEWKGSFYPERMPAKKMLGFYAGQFATVEINYTFYRMPNEKTLAGWADATPEGFKFVLKAPKRITHDARLRDCEDRVRAFADIASTLGPKLGPLLFQLPPNFKQDLAVLETFLDYLPRGARVAMEFRHPSWHDDAVFERLKARNVGLCVMDSESMSTPAMRTADFGYFRLRDEGYQDADIARWAEVIQNQDREGEDTFAFFKHEDKGIGPQFARQLLGLLKPGAGAGSAALPTSAPQSSVH